MAQLGASFLYLPWSSRRSPRPAQSGNAGTVRGAVTDPSGAVIPNATVHLTDKVSGFDRTTTSDATGQFAFSNVPFNPYKIDVSAKGFAPLSQSVEIDLRGNHRSIWFFKLLAQTKPSPSSPGAT